MSIRSFPDRLRTRRRAPITPAQRAARRRTVQHFAGGALLALAAVALVVLWPYPPLAVLVPALIVAVAFVVSDPDSPLLATVAPLPDVHTPPVATATGLIEVVHIMPTARPMRPTPYIDPLTATAEDVGVLRAGRHAHVPASDDATRAIPAVQR